MLRFSGVVMSLQALPAQAEQLFRYLFEQASLGIAVEDLEGKLLLANPALCSMLGYTEKELCCMSCSEFANPEDSQDDWALFQQLRAGVIDHYSLEKRYVRKDGAQIWGNLNVSLLKEDDEGPPLVFAFVEEITKRKLAEEALRESEERFRLMADTAPVLIWMSGTDKLCTYFNKPWLDFTGQTLESQVGNQWAGRVHPDDLNRCLATYTRSFDRRESFRMKYRLQRHDGEHRWIFDIGVPRYTQEGSFGGYIGSSLDITEHKQAEEEARMHREELAHLSRVAIMGEMAGSLAHELNQPLTGIMNNARDGRRSLAH